LTQSEQSPDDHNDFRCGFVALIGRPNSGKSSLLNTILSEQLSIVTPLPQTTRKNLKGIFTDPQLQLIFFDTPGIHNGKYSLNKAMTAQGAVLLGSEGADIVCYLVDLSRAFGAEEDLVARLVTEARKPLLIIFNKSDLCADCEKMRQEFFTRYPALAATPHITVSALQEQAKELFLTAIRPLVPVGPAHYPEDELTDENMRFFAAEFIRKQIITATTDEVPHATFVEIIDYKEEEDRHRIDANIHVETIGQRGIIVGKNGKLIQQIQRQAAREMSDMAGCPVTIKCHVKITPRWRDNQRFLRSMGYEKTE
jgi:GTP-binding protein Era